MLTVNVFGTFSHWSLSLNVLYMTNFLSIDYIFDDLLVNSVPDPHLEIRWGGGELVIQTLRWRGGGLPKNVFRPVGSQFGLKIRWGPRPLPWICNSN